MSKSQAKLELALWQAEANLESSSDLYIRLAGMGLPPEVAIRLKELIEYVKPIGDKVFSIGKIIVRKLIDFIAQHPNLATGLLLGAVFSTLITSIPFLGPILAPIALPIGITIGAVAGHRVDLAKGGKMNDNWSITAITQDVIEIARSFFELLIATLLTIFADFEQ